LDKVEKPIKNYMKATKKEDSEENEYWVGEGRAGLKQG